MGSKKDFTADAIVVGSGLAGLVATYELTQAGKRALVVDQENRNNLGGQAFWSLGGLFLVDTPSSAAASGIHDSKSSALTDWMGSAQFDRDDEDYWGRQWARAYVHFAATEKRDYLHGLGLRITPVVGWAERGGGFADGHGNSVPVSTSPGAPDPKWCAVFAEPVLKAEKRGWSSSRSDTVSTNSSATTVRSSGPRVGAGATADAERGIATSREVVGEFEFPRTGGHRHHRRDRPQPRTGPGEFGTDRPGPIPEHMIAGVPAYVDGRMLAIAQDAGANLVNRDRMWHHTEGIHNGTRSGPTTRSGSSPACRHCGLDANGERLEPPNFPRLRHQLTMKAIPPPVTTTRGSSSPTRSSRRVRTVGVRAEPDITEKDSRSRQEPPGQGCARAHPGVPRPRRGLRHRAEPRRSGRQNE